MSVIKDRILTSRNVAKLIKIINEDIELIKYENGKKIRSIIKLIEDKTKRREKLFNALETSEELEMHDISPRLKELNQKIEDYKMSKRNYRKRY